MTNTKGAPKFFSGMWHPNYHSFHLVWSTTQSSGCSPCDSDSGCSFWSHFDPISRVWNHEYHNWEKQTILHCILSHNRCQLLTETSWECMCLFHPMIIWESMRTVRVLCVSLMHTQQIEIQLSVIHNYASHYLGLVIGSENPAAKSYSIVPACFIIIHFPWMWGNSLWPLDHWVCWKSHPVQNFQKYINKVSWI